jgi:hypothetical protein
MIFSLTTWVVASALATTVLGGTTLAQSGDPNVGTWKLNVAKSNFSPGTELKSGTLKIEPAGAGVKLVADLAYADGTARHYDYTANYDGKDTPVTGNNINGEVIALTQVDANTTRTVYKKGGKVTVTQTTVVSSDGKTRTTTSKGTNTLGRAVDNVTVTERQ